VSFLSQMERVLAVYALPYDSAFPVICFDERPCQLIGEVLVPLPMKPGQVKRQDYEYCREGVCCVLLAVEPLTGWRYVEVRSRRTREDYAEFMQAVARQFSEARQIRLIQDNLNTHEPGSFYTVLPPQAAFALAERFEWHYTPKKGSWLNMAEIDFSALSKQCLDRRIPSQATLSAEVLAWVKERHDKRIQIRWQFSKEQARDKFQRFYPTLKN
jgi:transposase